MNIEDFVKSIIFGSNMAILGSQITSSTHKANKHINKLLLYNTLLTNSYELLYKLLNIGLKLFIFLQILSVIFLTKDSLI